MLASPPAPANEHFSCGLAFIHKPPPPRPPQVAVGLLEGVTKDGLSTVRPPAGKTKTKIKVFLNRWGVGAARGLPAGQGRAGAGPCLV